MIQLNGQNAPIRRHSIDQKKNIINASDIKFGSLSSTEKIEPVYHTTSGLNQKTLGGYINNVLLKHGNDIEDKIPRYLLDKYDFLGRLIIKTAKKVSFTEFPNVESIVVYKKNIQYCVLPVKNKIKLIEIK